MLCPKCNSYNTKCTDTVQYVGYRRRRYICKDCGCKFVSKEESIKMKDPDNKSWEEVIPKEEDSDEEV